MAEGDREVVIRLKELHKHFGPAKILNGVNLEVYKGEMLAVIGTSGCGKSTVLKHIVGLLTPTSGEVWVDGVDVAQAGAAQLQKVREHLGVVFQHAALLASLSVGENIALPLREHTTMREQEIRAVVEEKLRLVYMDPDYVYDKLVSELSGGMRKRVGLARALVRNPAVILYDEPTTGLDPVISAGVHDLMKDLCTRLGVTSIMITHDIANCYRIADRMVMLYEGKVIETGTVEEMKVTTNPIVKQLLEGEPEGPLTEAMKSKAAD